MSRILVFVALVGLALGFLIEPTTAETAAAVSSPSRPVVRIAGNRLVGGAGTPVRLLGVNRAGLEYACAQGWGLFDGPSDQTSVDAIAAWHVNAVRVPLNEDCWLGINGVDARFSGATYRAAVQDYVAKLHGAGLIAVLDLHWSAPGGDRALSQQVMADADHSPSFWSSVASTFLADPGVVFDLYNEPHDISWSCWRDGCTNGAGWQVAGMQQLLDAVRTTGATQPVLVAGLGWAGDLSQWLTWHPVDPIGQLAASAHLYNFSGCNTVTCWDTTIAPVAAQVPVVTGEIGEDDCDHRFIDAYMGWADRHSVSYLGWAWNTADCANGPSLVSGYDGTPTSFGVGLRDHLAAAATAPTPYVLDGYGGLHGTESVRTSDAWPGWNIARSSALLADGSGGYVLDGWGGVHPFAVGSRAMPPAVTVSDYWDRWDIARDIALLGDGSGGYVLDGWGGVHPFAIGSHAMPPAVQQSASWAFRDVARGIALLGDGSGGYVLDGWGGVHPFAVGDSAMPAAVTLTGSWPGWDIARDMALLGDGSGGYVLDGWGGVHPFAVGSHAMPPAVRPSGYWPFHDVARGIAVDPDGAGGDTLTEDGTVAPFAIGTGNLPATASIRPLPPGAVARAIVIR